MILLRLALVLPESPGEVPVHLARSDEYEIGRPDISAAEGCSVLLALVEASSTPFAGDAAGLGASSQPKACPLPVPPDNPFLLPP